VGVFLALVFLVAKALKKMVSLLGLA